MSIEGSQSGPAAENDFCAGCGLCCDGTLFRRGRVSEGEDADLIAQGFDLFDLDGEQQFRMPCPMLREGLCTIYSSRPKTCRDFRCKLLKRHMVGELEPGEGRLRVARAKALKEAVVARDPEGAFDGLRQGLWQSLADAVKTAAGKERDAIASRLLAVASLESYLRQWFRDERRK